MICNSKLSDINPANGPSLSQPKLSDFSVANRLSKLKISEKNSAEKVKLEEELNAARELEKQEKYKLDKTLNELKSKRLILNELKDEYLKIIQEAKIKYKSLEINFKNLTKEIEVKQQNINSLQNQLNSLTNQTRTKEERAKEITQKIKFLDESLRHSNEKYLSINLEKNNLTSTLNNLHQNYSGLINSFQTFKEDHKKRLKDLNRKLDHQREKIRDLKDELSSDSDCGTVLSRRADSPPCYRDSSPSKVWIDDDDFGWGGGYY
ncbi:hypothetical protein BpHYR1_022359 [Brachionus plicatilis]|uniref:Uncharacterized protein n=1 Tax=Brachionus plicatilis TaxID=10195 RepID=A0A3M7P642_BRAPC|nr:hypothetical protein BpHYR1_022359 [Brachionus plicatilis]